MQDDYIPEIYGITLFLKLIILYCACKQILGVVPTESAFITHTCTLRERRHNELLWGDRYVYYFDLDSGFTGVCPNLSNCIH